MQFEGELPRELSWDARTEVQSLLGADIFFKSSDVEFMFEDCAPMTFFSNLATSCFQLNALGNDAAKFLVPDQTEIWEISLTGNSYTLAGRSLPGTIDLPAKEFDAAINAALRELARAYRERFPQQREVILLTHSILIN